MISLCYSSTSLWYSLCDTDDTQVQKEITDEIKDKEDYDTQV